MPEKSEKTRDFEHFKTASFCFSELRLLPVLLPLRTSLPSPLRKADPSERLQPMRQLPSELLSSALVSDFRSRLFFSLRSLAFGLGFNFFEHSAEEPVGSVELGQHHEEVTESLSLVRRNFDSLLA